ncbi:glycine-rich domain-containing protein [Pseudomonas cerasi]
MHRIDTSTAQVDKFGAGKNGFTGGNPQTGELPTALDQDFFDSLQEELSAVIEGASIPLKKASRNQLFTALKKLFIQSGNNLSEIAAAGAGSINAALSNLTIGIRNSMTFPTTTTWTCPDGVTTVYVDACAAGGGGGYSASGNAGAGGGGGGQAVIRRVITVVPGTMYTITIGGPGTGGTSSSVNGTQGGNTTFGNLLTLVGGYGGLSNGTAGASGGDGGVAATAGVRTSSISFGGAGGGSLFGPGGAGGNGAMFGSIPGMFGGGGGGGAAGDGARGAYGFMRIWW